MPGAQNGVYQGIGGGLVKIDSTGQLLSPPVTGYTGMGGILRLKKTVQWNVLSFQVVDVVWLLIQKGIVG